MHTTVAHLISLIFCGKLNSELFSAYQEYSRESPDGSAYSCIVRHCFLRTPSPDVQHHADSLLLRFQRANASERSCLFSYSQNLDYVPYEYELLKEDIDLADHWGISIPEDVAATQPILSHGASYFARSTNQTTAQSAHTPRSDSPQSALPQAEEVASSSFSLETLLDNQEMDSICKFNDQFDANGKPLVAVLSVSASFDDSAYRTVGSEIPTTSDDTTSVVEPDDSYSLSYEMDEGDINNDDLHEIYN